MSENRNSNVFWKNVATGIGVAAAGAALGYLMSELFTGEATQSNHRSEETGRSHQRCGPNTLELRNSIIDKLNSGTYECNICLEEISRRDKIVSCKTCYNLNHLKCMIRHCNISGDSDRRAECPSCRAPINYNLEYRCFCGKELNPIPRQGVIPHCCLSKCSVRGCRLRCHPGPCSSVLHSR